MGIRARGGKNAVKKSSRKSLFLSPTDSTPFCMVSHSYNFFRFPMCKMVGQEKPSLVAISQTKEVLLTGQHQIRNGRGLQSLQYHSKHKRTSQIFPSSFLIPKSIRNFNTQETGHLLISKTSALEQPANNTNYHKTSIFQQLS